MEKREIRYTEKSRVELGNSWGGGEHKGCRNSKQRGEAGEAFWRRWPLNSPWWIWWIKGSHKFFDILPLRNEIFTPSSECWWDL